MTRVQEPTEATATPATADKTYRKLERREEVTSGNDRSRGHFMADFAGFRGLEGHDHLHRLHL